MVAGHGSSGEQVRCIRPHRILLGPLSNHDSRYSRRPPPVYAGGWAVSRGRWGLCYSSLVPKGPRSSGDRAPPSGGGCGRSNRPGGTALGQHKRPDLGSGVVVRGMVCGMGLAIVPHMPRRRRRARGHIEELPSGSFRAVVYAGMDPLTGKPRYLRETAKTYDAAEVALTKLQSQVDEDRHPKTAITVRQAVAQWLEVVKLEDTTRERYDDLIRLYILPTFGEMQAGAGCAPAPRPTAAVGRRGRSAAARTRTGPDAGPTSPVDAGGRAPLEEQRERGRVRLRGALGQVPAQPAGQQEPVSRLDGPVPLVDHGPVRDARRQPQRKRPVPRRHAFPFSPPAQRQTEALAVLLPVHPGADLVALLNAHGVRCICEASPDNFERCV